MRSADSPIGETSLDAFYHGSFHLLQPAGRGFRSGLDALLLAAAVPADARGTAVDMGAGAGAAGFAAACRARRLDICLAEGNATMADLARQSLQLAQNQGFAGRLSVTTVNLLARRPEREAAGLVDGGFDLVLTNPPFHPVGSRSATDELRNEARALPDEDFLPRWVTVAASLLRPDGRFLMIGRSENLHAILAAAENRLGALAVRPLHTKPDAPATRILVSAVRGSRLPLRLLPSIFLDSDHLKAIGAGEHEFAFS